MAIAAEDVENAGVKNAAQIHDSSSSENAAYSLREGRVEEQKSWMMRLWQSFSLELTETRGVSRVLPEERQKVSKIPLRGRTEAYLDNSLPFRDTSK